MVKLKNPLLSFGAVGRLTKALTFTRRRKTAIVEKYPLPTDVKSLAQLSWRHMYQKAVALWHALSAAEQQDWESQARSRHMTGFAWFMSQALKPNPGLYLPLQGGTMAGDIDMAKNRLLKLPFPGSLQEAIRVQEYNALITPYLYKEGARAYHNAAQTIPDITITTLAFDSELWDTDNIHDLIINNERLTCKTAGTYLIIAHLNWSISAAGRGQAQIRHSNGQGISFDDRELSPVAEVPAILSTIYTMAVNQYIWVRVYQTSGGNLNVEKTGQWTPHFMMFRIGP